MNSFKERVSAEGIRRATLLGDDRPLNWRATLPPLKAGGPYEMTIAGADTITITNVLVGEAWTSAEALMTLEDFAPAARYVAGGPEVKALRGHAIGGAFPYSSSIPSSIAPREYVLLNDGRPDARASLTTSGVDR